VYRTGEFVPCDVQGQGFAIGEWLIHPLVVVAGQAMLIFRRRGACRYGQSKDSQRQDGDEGREHAGSESGPFDLGFRVTLSHDLNLTVRRTP
jgi:hypothetical protein